MMSRRSALSSQEPRAALNMRQLLSTDMPTEFSPTSSPTLSCTRAVDHIYTSSVHKQIAEAESHRAIDTSFQNDGDREAKRILYESSSLAFPGSTTFPIWILSFIRRLEAERVQLTIREHFTDFIEEYFGSKK